MTNLYLPTSSKVKIFVKGVDLDLAFRLDWKESQPRIPIYGYNDTEYTKTIRGRKLIQGFLVMNFIAPHYLSAVLENWQLLTAHRDKAEFDGIMDSLPGADNVASRKARAEILASYVFGKRESENHVTSVMGSELQALAAKGKAGLAYTAQKKNLTKPPQGGVPDFKKRLMKNLTQGDDIIVPKIAGPGEYNAPFDLEVYYVEPEYADWYVILNDVEITDVSQTVNAAGADGSSEPLYETYEFIANRRTVKRVGQK